MFNKFTALVFASAFAAPVFAGGISGGHRMQAELLGLDATQFTVNELAVIDADAKQNKDFERASLIAARKVLGANDAVASDSESAYVPRGRDDA